MPIRDLCPTDCYLEGFAENLYGHKRKLRFVLQALENWAAQHHRVPHVLDVGCGTGAVLTQHLGKAGYDVLGIDTDATSIAVAQSEFQSSNLKFQSATLREVSGIYEAVVLSEVLEHVADPHSLLAMTRKLLEPEGLLIVTVPNGFGPFELEKALWKLARMDDLWVRGAAPRLKGLLRRRSADSAVQQVPNSIDTSPHINFFTQRSMKQLLISAGFRVEKVGKSSLLGGPFSDTFLPKSAWLYRLNAAAGGVVPAFLVNGHYFLATLVRPAGSTSFGNPAGT